MAEKHEKADVAGNLLFALGLVSLMAAVVGFSVWGKGRPIEMGIASVAALVVMLLSKSDRIQLIEAGSVKLQIREAKRVVHEAQVSIENVRALAGGLSAISLEMLSIQGKWGTIPSPKKLAMKETIDGILDDLGVDRVGELWQASERFVARLDFDHARKIVSSALSALNLQLGSTSEEYVSLQATLASYVTWERVKKIEAERLRKFILDSGVKDDETIALLDDFDHFQKNRKFRRPESWGAEAKGPNDEKQDG